jgi:hypothetical protein
MMNSESCLDAFLLATSWVPGLFIPQGYLEELRTCEPADDDETDAPGRVEMKAVQAFSKYEILFRGR